MEVSFVSKTQLICTAPPKKCLLNLSTEILTEILKQALDVQADYAHIMENAKQIVLVNKLFKELTKTILNMHPTIIRHRMHHQAGERLMNIVKENHRKWEEYQNSRFSMLREVFGYIPPELHEELGAGVTALLKNSSHPAFDFNRMPITLFYYPSQHRWIAASELVLEILSRQPNIVTLEVRPCATWTKAEWGEFTSGLINVSLQTSVQEIRIDLCGFTEHRQMDQLGEAAKSNEIKNILDELNNTLNRNNKVILKIFGIDRLK